MKVLIVDDHAIFRRGVKEILADAFPEAEFVDAPDAQTALDQLWQTPPDLLILDLSLPGRSGLEVLREIRTASPQLPVLVLSMHGEEQYAVRALKLGAAGYLTKIQAAQELINAVRKVLSGGRYVSPTLAEHLAVQLATGSDRPPHETLSHREFQVFRFLAEGKTVKDIATSLSLSVQTISTHRARLLQKMRLRSNAELMRYALEHQLLGDLTDPVS